MPNYVAVCIPKQILDAHNIDRNQINVEKLQEHETLLTRLPVDAESKEWVSKFVSICYPSFCLVDIKEES